MTATATPITTTSTETFGLPPEAAHLIAKLRNMPPEQLAQIRNTGAQK